MSFVHCVEGGGSECVRAGLEYGSWEAFAILAWLGSGAPTSILLALPGELQAHTDPRLVQGRFVDEIERYRGLLRGAECDPVGIQQIGPLIPHAAATSEKRLKALGLWRNDLERIVRGLSEEAKAGLDDGWLIRMQCKDNPFELYLATAVTGNSYAVIGVTTLLPDYLGGQALTPEQVQKRILGPGLGLAGAAQAVQEGIVHPWVPIPQEEF